MAPLSCRILRRSDFLTQYRGRDAIAGFFQSVLEIYPGFQFENIKVLIDTPDQAFAEFEATAVSGKTGRSVHQLFFARLVAENGIKLFREALNTVEVARANVLLAGNFLAGLHWRRQVPRVALPR
jgi:SnoaL-like domain